MQVLGAEVVDDQVTVSYLISKNKSDNNALKLHTITGTVQGGLAGVATEDWCEAALAKAYQGW